jgi:hypothetical protein
MAAKKSLGLEKIGHYSFLAGVLIAILAGFVPQLQGIYAIWLMAGLGVIVGLLNITSKEVTVFLVATTSLIIASSASALSLALIWEGITSILANIIYFVAPAAIIVSLKAIYALAEKK